MARERYRPEEVASRLRQDSACAVPTITGEKRSMLEAHVGYGP